MTAPPPPGSITEEAAKLLEALGAWATGAAGAGGSGDADADVGEGRTSGFADGSAACRLCPVCQLIAAVRQTRPETYHHLLDASSALTAALRSVVESGAHPPARPGGVERIDLDPPAPGPMATPA
jgi:hypothetical protein